MDYDMREAIEQVGHATRSGDWTCVGNTVYFYADNQLSEKDRKSWVAFPGDCERAYAIAEMPRLFLRMIDHISRLEKEVKRLVPFQQGYDDVCGDQEFLRQVARADRAEKALLQAAEDLEHAAARLENIHTLLARELATSAKQAYAAYGKKK